MKKSLVAIILAGSCLVCFAQAPHVIWSQIGHASQINSVAFSPDGTLLATAGDDTEVKLWRASDGAYLGLIDRHPDGAQTVQFSHRGNLLAAGGIDRNVSIVRVSDFARLVNVEGTGFVRGVAFAANDMVIATSLGYSSNELCLYRVSDGELMGIHRDHWGTVWGVDFSGDGRFMATCGADSRTLVYTYPNRNLLFDLGGHQDDVISVKFSSDSRLLASAGEADWTVRVWQMPSGGSLRTFDAGHRLLHGIAFSPDAAYLAAAGEDFSGTGSILIWDIASGALARRYLQGLDRGVHSIAFSPDGSKLAYGLHNGAVAVATNPLFRVRFNGAEAIAR